MMKEVVPKLWTDMTEKQLQEERKRIQKDQAAHTGEKGNEPE